MQSKIIERILTENNELLQEIINIVKDNDVFNEVMSEVKEQYFIDDAIHGISHNERVALLACYIGIKEGLNNEELRLILEASKYHDIGRGFEGNHGQVSTSLIDRNRGYILPNLKDNEVNIVKALCHGHNVDDKKYEEIARLYGIENFEQFKKLLDIVKDADALDRVRLPRFGQLDEKYLRTEISKEMIDASKELFRKYIEIQRELENNNSRENIETSNYVFNEGLRRGLLFDGENYYLVRSLNKSDIDSINNGSGIIQKIESTDEHTIQDVMAQIRMQHRKTSLISMSEDPNIVLTYDRTNLHRFALIRLSKDEIKNHKKVFSAGEYLLGVMDKKIENAVQNAPENVRNILGRVDSASSIDEIVKIINGADRQVPTSLVEAEQQYLTPEEQLEQSKKIAKCKVLNYYGLIRNITYDEKGKPVDISSFTQIMRNGYSSSEWLYSGKIGQEKIINIPQILVDSLALIKQAEFQGKDRETLKRIEQEILRLAISGVELNQDNYQLEYTSHENLRSDLTIDKAYEITNGQISYRDTNMQITAIRSLAEMTLNKRKIIELLQAKFPNVDVEELLSDTYCVNQELMTRQNNRGSQIGRNISFIISDYGYDFASEISGQILQNVESLTDEQLINIISQGVNAQEISSLLIRTRENDERIQATKSKTLGSKYIAEAIVEGYNWRQTGNSLTKQEKTLVANTLLKGLTANNGVYKLYEAINKTQIGKNKFTQNEVFAIIINLAIDRKIGNISYSELLKKDKSEIQHILLDNKESLQTFVLPISIDLLAGRGKEVNKLKKELINLEIEEDFIDSKDIKNVYVAKQIVEGYDFGREITEEEKRAMLYAILNNSLLNKNRFVYLSKLLQNLEILGISKQERYGVIINASINGNILGKEGYDYSSLLANKNGIFMKLIEHKDELQTYVKDTDILTAMSITLSKVQSETIRKSLIDLGINNEFLNSIKIENIYIASHIIENYDFGRDLSNDEKKSILISILDNSQLKENNHSMYLSTLIRNMDKIGLSTQEIYGMIINLGINGKVLEENGYSYTNLLMNKDDSCKTVISNKNEIPTKVTELDILIALSKNINEKELENLKKELLDIGINEDFISLKSNENIYIAIQIIKRYEFNQNLSKDEKKAILYSILDMSILNKRQGSSCYISSLMKRMQQIGLNEQEIYGMIINLGINGNALRIAGYDYNKLLMNKSDVCKTIANYKDDIQTRVTNGSILTAVCSRLNDLDFEKIKKQLLELGFDEEFLNSKKIQNLYVAEQIVDKFEFKRELTKDERKSIIYSILNNKCLSVEQNCYLCTLIKNIEQIGLNEQEIYGMIINLGVNGSVLEETGFDYSKLLSNANNIYAMKQYKNKIQTNVSETTILTAVANNLDEDNLNKIVQELLNFGMDKEFLNSKKTENIYVAKYIAENFNFGRTLSSDEKNAIIYSVLNNSRLNKPKGIRLSTFINRIKQIGLNEQEIYEMIINLGINGKIIKENGYSYRELLTNTNNSCQTIVQYKDEIKTTVTEETIQKAVAKANKPKKVKGQDIAKATMELTIKGSGGSELCDLVQADYQRLLDEKIKENEKEGSEQGDTN